jgi:hypothetical protein
VKIKTKYLLRVNNLLCLPGVEKDVEEQYGKFLVGAMLAEKCDKNKDLQRGKRK